MAPEPTTNGNLRLGVSQPRQYQELQALALRINSAPPRRPNDGTWFPAFLSNEEPLRDSPSPLIPQAWATALQGYPGDLGITINGILRFGAAIGYNGEPNPLILSDNLVSAQDDPSVLQKGLDRDLALERVSPCLPARPFICSPQGLVPKKDGGFRRIHHLSHPAGSSVNDGIPREWASLEYAALNCMLDMVRKAGRGAWLMKRDLKDAFRLVPVAHSQKRLLGFTWQGQYYHENCLPFGLRTAPLLFNLFAEGLHWIFMATWTSDTSVLMEHYLDDFVIALPSTAPTALRNLVSMRWLAVLWYLGMIPNTAKDEQGTTIEILGIEIDTLRMEARLSQKRIDEALSRVHDALDSKSLSLRDVQTLGGFLSFCAAVVQLGRTFLCSLWEFLASFSTRPHRRRTIPATLRVDLHWWRDLLPEFNGVMLLEDTARQIYHVFTDASGTGYGAFWYPSNSPADAEWLLQLPLPQNQAVALTRLELLSSTDSINVAETLCVLLALDKWRHCWIHGTIVVHTDNETARAALLSGTTRSPTVLLVLKALLRLASAMDIKVHASRISSEENTLADAISRQDWPLIANLCPNWQSPLPVSPVPLSWRDWAASLSTKPTPS